MHTPLEQARERDSRRSPHLHAVQCEAPAAAGARGGTESVATSDGRALAAGHQAPSLIGSHLTPPAKKTCRRGRRRARARDAIEHLGGRPALQVDNFCASVRGAEMSRGFRAGRPILLLAEAPRAVEQGGREIIAPARAMIAATLDAPASGVTLAAPSARTRKPARTAFFGAGEGSDPSTSSTRNVGRPARAVQLQRRHRRGGSSRWQPSSAGRRSTVLLQRQRHGVRSALAGTFKALLRP